MSDPQAAVTQQSRMQTLVKAPLSDRNEPRSGGDAAAGKPSADLDFMVRSSSLRVGQRNMLSLLLLLGVCAWFWVPLGKLWSLAFENEQFSHVVLVPWVSLYLLFLKRADILTSKDWNLAVGALLLGGGAFVYWAVESQDWTPDRLAVAIAAFVLTCWGIVLAGFGGACFRKNSFALLFLLFMAPLPSAILDAVIGFLQRSSAEAVELLFTMLGIPVFREGVTFSLSHFTIHVAEECSGIRSFISLVITALLAGHWFLKSGWAKLGLVGVVVPLAIVKNACRIVGLTLLANYVDPTYITNSVLHRTGGIPLFLLSLLILFSLVWLLRRLEKRMGYGS